MLKLVQNKWYPPKPSTESFSGKTILVTGASSGLGLEAAKKLAARQTTKLVITARTTDKGEETRKTIQSWLASSNASTSTEIVVVPLDMTTAESVKAFIPRLKAEVESLDAVILNAGITQPAYEATSDGYEKTIQINTLSTILLSLCLLPILVSRAQATDQVTQLTFVSSGTATRLSLASLEPYMQEEHPIAAMSKPEAFVAGLRGGPAKYAQSKLMLEYAMRQIAQLPSLRDDKGELRVIINSVCPGMCKSDLGRNFTGLAAATATWLIFTFFARTAEQGSNSYVSALTRGKEANGKLWRHDQYEPEWEAIQSEQGKELGKRVWKEMVGIITSWEPAVKELLQK